MNTDRQQFENDKQNVDLALLGKSSADAQWSCFIAFVFSCFHSLRIVCFFPFSYFRLQNKQNQPAFCYYFIKITYNNQCYTQITMGVADYSKRQL